MKPNVVFFSDFDGTITTRDTGTIIIDHCMGRERRRALDVQVLNNENTYRKAVIEMWSSVTLTFPEALNLLKDVTLDPGFPDFYSFLTDHNIPLNVVSAGLTPLCKKFLDPLTTNDTHPSILQIFANEIDIKENWNIIYRDNSDYGHDKGSHIRDLKASYADGDTSRPLLIFIGDGVSDISAAKEADVLFAKAGKDLENWCKRENVDYIAWDSFHSILKWLQDHMNMAQ